MIDGTKGKVVLSVAPGTKARENAGLSILVGGGVFVVTGLVISWSAPTRTASSRADCQATTVRPTAVT